jgi:hypothetical protein
MNVGRSDGGIDMSNGSFAHATFLAIYLFPLFVNLLNVLEQSEFYEVRLLWERKLRMLLCSLLVKSLKRSWAKRR